MAEDTTNNLLNFDIEVWFPFQNNLIVSENPLYVFLIICNVINHLANQFRRNQETWKRGCCHSGTFYNAKCVQTHGSSDCVDPL